MCEHPVQEARLTTPKILNPASKLLPGPIPRLEYRGLPNRTAPNASSERQMSLLAKREAAYSG